MCFMIVLGASEAIPFQQWKKYTARLDEEVDLHIFVQSRGRAENGDWNKIFGAFETYWVSTRHTGDGCGFVGEYERARDAREELADFLDEAVKSVPDLKMFVEWHDFGESEVIPTAMQQIGPSDIRMGILIFNTETLYQVIRED